MLVFQNIKGEIIMIYRIIYNKKVHIIFFITILINCISFFNVLIFNGESSFFESTLLTSTYNTSFRGIYMLILFPLLSCLCLSDIFLEDKQLNLTYLWYTKLGIIKYHFKNFAYVFFIPFAITLIGLILNIILCYISFGAIDVSYTNIFADINLETYRNQAVNFDMFLKNPILFLMFMSFLISVFAGLFAQFSYVLSIIIKNRYLLVIIPTLIYTAITLVFSVFDLPGLAIYFLLTANFSIIMPNPNLVYYYIIGLILINISFFTTIIIKERNNV